MIFNGNGLAQPVDRVTLMWTNDNADTTFREQTVGFNKAGCQIFIIRLKENLTTDAYVVHMVFDINSENRWNICNHSDTWYRHVEVTSTGISFGHCNSVNSTGSNNDYLIPIEIYGVY